MLAVQLYVEFEMSAVVCNDGVMIIKRVLHKFRSIFINFGFLYPKKSKYNPNDLIRLICFNFGLLDPKKSKIIQVI